MRFGKHALRFSAAHFVAHGEREAERGPRNDRADYVFDLLFPDIEDFNSKSGGRLADVTKSTIAEA